MDTPTKIGIAAVLVIVVIAAIVMAIGGVLSWFSGGFNYSAGVQAGNSLVADGEWAIGLTALAIVVVVALALKYGSGSGGYENPYSVLTSFFGV